MWMAAEAFKAMLKGLAGMSMLRRAPTLADVAEVAAFLASDRASGMTATIANDWSPCRRGRQRGVISPSSMRRTVTATSRPHRESLEQRHDQSSYQVGK
jgi:hypothetical protein